MARLSRRLLVTAAAGAGLTVGIGSMARAAEATPAEAANMETQVRQGISDFFGPALKLSERPVHVTAEGDHYNIDLPFPVGRVAAAMSGPAGPAPESAASKQVYDITGSARPADGGTWVVDHVRVSSPLTFTMNVPVAGGAKPGQTGEPVTYTIDQNGQDGRLVWDPSFRTASTWTFSAQSTTIHAEGATIKQDGTIGPASAVTTVQPDGPDRIDVLVDSTVQDYRSDMAGPSGPGKLGMARIHVTGAVNNVNRENGVKLTQAITALLASGVPKASPALNPMVKAMLVPLQDLASSITLDEQLDGLAVQTAGQDVTADHMRLGLDARSEGGLVRAGMDLDLQGFALPSPLLGPFAALMPKRIEMRPVVSGVTAADLLHMANLATDNIDPTPDDIKELFSHGGVTGGLESMTLDIGGATFTGQGSVVASAPTPTAVTGTGTVTAKNFDALMQAVGAIPGVGQQGMVGMVFMKGIGRSVGDTLVWDISYKNQHVLVNNVDLTAMAGSAAAAPQPTAPAEPEGPAARGTKRPARPGQVPSWAK